MNQLLNFLLDPDSPWIIRILNLIVSAFGALMMFSMRTETSTKEHPWTKYLGIAFSIFAAKYAVLSADIPTLTQPLLRWVPGDLSFFWSEVFSLPINVFLLLAAMTLLRRGARLPGWFFVLLAADLMAVAVMLSGLPVGVAKNTIPTLCRLVGDLITFTSLMCLGYASYINTRYYESKFGVFLGLFIGIIYGGIHLINPFGPNISAAYTVSGTEANVVLNRAINASLISIAALSKLVLMFFALKITALEHQALIKLRDRLRESVRERKAFFSREGILDAIRDAFGAAGVKLYIKVPSSRTSEAGSQAHVYSWGKAPKEYEVTSESKTPLPALLSRLIGESPKTGQPAPAASGGSRPGRIFHGSRYPGADAELDGVEPIRYYGALIGCLVIEKGTRGFTYSAKRLFEILSEDISVLVEFYRLNESLQALIESLKEIIRTPPNKAKLEALRGRRFADLYQPFEEVLQQVLSPRKTTLIVTVGFVETGGPEALEADRANALADGRKPVIYECITDEARGGPSIGLVSLEYQRGSDPPGEPSLGYFRTFGQPVVSVVTKFLLSAVEQKFNLIIAGLSAELGQAQTFDTWLTYLRKSALAAELAGVVVYARDLPEFQHIVKDGDADDSRAVGAALAAAFPDVAEVLNLLEDEKPRVVAWAPDRLVVGVKLPRCDAGLFFGVRRAQFVDELDRALPWRAFLLNLAGVAGNALARIITALHIQKTQIERAEDYMVISTAEKVNMLTHELINSIENLDSDAALFNFDVASLDVAPALKKSVEARVGKLSADCDMLRSLAQSIRNSSRVPEASGPCWLMETLRKMANLHEVRSNIKIEAGPGIAIPSELPGPPRILKDVEVALPEFIVEQTFGNLISNSIDAIKRKANGDGGPAGRFKGRDAIRIWAEADGSKYINCFINDTGAGVEPHLRDAIFNVNVTTTPGKGGWGLFYVRRKLVGKGGSIELEHSEPGDTTFRVRLPKFIQ
jgi:signal transduction histidine kinase